MNQREASQQNWGTRDLMPTQEQINTGCLQRIADAAELMAKNHAQLVRERDDYERRLRTIRGEVNRLDRSNAALRGVITRMKRKAAS